MHNIGGKRVYTSQPTKAKIRKQTTKAKSLSVVLRWNSAEQILPNKLVFVPRLRWDA